LPILFRLKIEEKEKSWGVIKSCLKVETKENLGESSLAYWGSA
jgi:hypothetical protein